VSGQWRRDGIERSCREIPAVYDRSEGQAPKRANQLLGRDALQFINLA